MPEFENRVRHYGTKCRQHLSRVRLSHVLALRAVESAQSRSDQKVKDLRSTSPPSRQRGEADVNTPTRPYSSWITHHWEVTRTSGPFMMARIRPPSRLPCLALE
jgi:hypothetical protein